MVRFCNISYDQYLEKYNDRKIICIGAGGTLKDFLKCQMEKVLLLEQIDIILDNDVCKTGEMICINRRQISVQMLSEFAKKNTSLNVETYIVFLFVANRYISEILNQLDQMSLFDEMLCVYGMKAISWGFEPFYTPLPVYPVLPRPKNVYSIPKIIHYCWFGEIQMGELNKRCIESWKRYCPDYEIKRWNETNYDLCKTPDYVKEAYTAKKYAFVSDYVRLDVVNQYGGFYLDTDVELFSSLDAFLPYKAVYGFMEYGEINTGVGFGSISGTVELQEQMRLYHKIDFLCPDGRLNVIPCPRYTNDYFRRKGVRLNNELQLVEDTLFLPSSYLCPLNPVLCDDGAWHLVLYALEDHTCGIHKCDNSWKNQDELKIFSDQKENYMKINIRLLQDWKRCFQRVRQ